MAGRRRVDAGRLDDLLARARREVDGGGLPNGQLAVGLDGELVAHETLGAPPDARFVVFSVTKAVTAGAVWLLFGEGGLSPDDRVADHLREFATHGKDAITEVPPSHWSTDDYFDADPRKPDHVYCRRGGFLSPVPFDPAAFGIPPSNLEATDTSQIIGLIAAKTALERAGYGEESQFERDQTAVILGVTGTTELTAHMSGRMARPQWEHALRASGLSPQQVSEISDRIAANFVAWQESTFPGLLGNVVAGRIANHLDLGGTNCVVDAACASSLAALSMAVFEINCAKPKGMPTIRQDFSDSVVWITSIASNCHLLSIRSSHFSKKGSSCSSSSRFSKTGTSAPQTSAAPTFAGAIWRRKFSMAICGLRSSNSRSRR